jgi:hypothetical protein
MEQAKCTPAVRQPWNEGRIVGQKAPFEFGEI